MKSKKKKIKEYYCWSCGFIIEQSTKPENCPECNNNEIKEEPIEE